MTCHQCSKPKFVKLNNGTELCLDCYSKLRQILHQEHVERVHQMNSLLDQMEATAGVYGVLPRHSVPTSPTNIIKAGPMTFNNININNSTVGSINTGTIHELDVHIGNVSKNNNPDLAESLKEFTEAVATTNEIHDKLKDEVLEQLKFVLDELKSNAPKKSVVKGVVDGIKTTVYTTATLVTVWEKLQPLLSMAFGGI